MKAIFFDTETTGLPLFSEPSEDPRQPHIVQLAALLVDLDTRKIISSMDVIVRPNGWTIPAEVAAIHGITTEHASDVGVPEPLALTMFMELWNNANTRIAHNEQFDARIVRIALMRYEDPGMADGWKAADAECTARLATKVCAIPPTTKMTAAGFTKLNTPNLGEAHQIVCGTPLKDAHTAMADVLGCMAVYFGIKDASIATAPAADALSPNF